MIIRQHDYKENEWEVKNAQANLREKEKLTTSKIAEETKVRDQALRDEIKNYISDVDEILTNSIVSVIIIRYYDR
jgi:hypothetical protein